MKFLITGGAGFIGSAVVRHLIEATADDVLVVDKLTYAGNRESLASVSSNTRYGFVRADIADPAAMTRAIDDFAPDVIMHLAAESHVDRSIDGPQAFIRTNLVGTFTLLEAALAYWRKLPAQRRADFRFQHISTDEVFGSLGPQGSFNEQSRYAPNSPYAASKAGSDHLVAAWHHTYGLPTLITNCSNNYGPFHFPEKLIPLTIINALEGKPLPVYGSGLNVRDWLHVDDHVAALLMVARRAAPGSTYTIGGQEERTNIDVVRSICQVLDAIVPDDRIGPRAALIQHVADRPGHDLRYAIDATAIRTDLGWRPRHSFDSGLKQTIEWYLTNRKWWERVRSGVYQGERLGIERASP